MHCWFNSQLGHIAWVAGQVSGREPARDNHMLMFFSLSFSLPLKKEKKNAFSCPGWFGSVGWVFSCKPKGHRFDS